MNATESLLDYPGLAALLNIPESWLRRNIKRLPHQKYGQYVRFGADEAAQIQELHRVQPGPAAVPTVAPALLELRPGRAPRGRRAA